MTRTFRCLLLAFAVFGAATAAFAQDDDRVLKPAEPDFTLISLPTSLRLPAGKMAFRVTHRFTRPLSCDACSNSVWGDALGLDTGARIGLELRYGLAPNAQVGVYRTSDKTVELFGQYAFLRQGAGSPIEASALLALDISNVGQQGADSEYSPVVGAILTRMVGEVAGLYVEPIWVHHANLFQPNVTDDDTFMIGLGARVRILDTVYVVGELAPRTGYDPGVMHGSFAIEKRAGGHLFSINFSDSFATAFGQIARGGVSGSDWYLGFNISRKFY
jgi:Membrane bound beta barrel domain (DUF5777)